MSAISEEAEHEGLSTNSKVNSILKKYVLFYRLAELDQPVCIPSRSFHFVLENIDESKLIEEYKTTVCDLIPSILVQQKIPLTIENWIRYVCDGILIYSGAIQNFSYHIDNEGCLCLAFKHVHGVKWSRIISKVFSYQLESMLQLHTVPTVLPSTIILKILEKGILPSTSKKS